MEHEFIKRLRSLHCGRLIGDDAAVLPLMQIGGPLVTVDMLTEGVDFILSDVDPRWVGRKALAVNLSDIAAMGGIPRWVFMAAALPKEGAADLAEQLISGALPLIEKFNLQLAGGDTNTWHGGLVISITLIGEVAEKGIFRRSGGKPGDKILVTGPLGGSILQHHFFFEPRIDEALYLNRHYNIHAAIDISDGLTLDLHRLTEESGLGAVLYETNIPISNDAAELASRSGRSPLEHALSDGEDFELLFTLPPQEAEQLLSSQPFQKTSQVTLYAIGELTASKGIKMHTAEGKVENIIPKGFEH